MKAVLHRSPTEIEVVEMADPEAGAGEILVRMKAIGLCGSDVSPWYVATKAPAVLGHETAGVVEAVGPGVTNVAPGDRVFVHHHAPCAACRACRRGDAVQCPEWKPAQLFPGGLAELVRVGSRTVANDTLRLPDGLSFEEGALVEPVACAVKAVERAQVRPGDAALVVGLGSNGVLLALLARDAGARFLVGVDPDPARRDLAGRFGFDVLVDPATSDVAAAARAATEGRGADAVFVIPTAEEVALSAIDAAAPGGTVVFYSPVDPAKTWRLAPSAPYFRDLTLRFSYSSGPAETRRALALLEAGVVRARDLVTHRLPLSRAAEGFRLAAAGGAALKVLIEP